MDATQNPPADDFEEIPEQTLDEMADAVRPADVDVQEWRDEAIEAITQMMDPPREIPPSWKFFLGSAVLSYIPMGFLLHDWILAADIMVILWIHESGHYLAKKAFGYREIQMFYIPLIGAAVTGKKNNATQVERALIALAGPVPCALISAVLLYGWCNGLFGTPSKTVVNAAYYTLLLNAPQLLPFLPLDGGHFFDALIFSRHPRLETAFRFIAGIAFLVIGLLWMSWILLGFAAIAFFVLGTAHRMSILSRRLREKGLNKEPAIEDMSLEEMMKAYALSYDLIPNSEAESMPRRVALRVGLLQRAYPGALAKPASIGAVIPLLLFYCVVVGGSIFAWRSVQTRSVNSGVMQEDASTETEEHPRLKITIEN
jgi:Zn-dependent protease